MVGFYNYTVIATYIGFSSGLLGLYFASQGQALCAIYCLLVSGFFDLIDGRIARRRARSVDEKRFGVQIDSLSDLVCFGVLPGMIGLSLVGPDHWLCLLVIIGYTLAGLIRLAYFNVMAAAQEESSSRGQMPFRGLPITSAGLIFPLLYCLRGPLPQSFPTIYILALLLTGYAFLAPFTMKKPGLAAQLLMMAVGLGTVIFLICAGAK